MIKKRFQKSRKIFIDYFVTFDSNSRIGTGGRQAALDFVRIRIKTWSIKRLCITVPPPDFQIFHQLWDLFVMVHYQMTWFALNQCFYFIIKIHVWYLKWLLIFVNTIMWKNCRNKNCLSFPFLLLLSLGRNFDDYTGFQQFPCYA